MFATALRPQTLGVSRRGLDARPRRSSRLSCTASATENPNLVTVTLPKPLGIVFEEREKGKASGVFVAELVKGGNAETSGKVKVGDVLVRCSAVLLKDGTEGQFQNEGYGQRPYNNFERVMFDAGAQTFDTIMGALGSNNERWGFNDIRLELERAGGAAAAAPAAAAAGSAPAPAASAAPAAAKPAAPAGPAVVQAEFRSVNGTATTVEITSNRGPIRQLMRTKEVEVYDNWGKVWNCNGAGSCGLCHVDIIEGADLLTERTDAENRLLKKKPETWRLSCQTLAADGKSGKLVVQAIPQGIKK